jgi:hypothetical protein
VLKGLGCLGCNVYKASAKIKEVQKGRPNKILFQSIKSLVYEVQQYVVRNVNTTMLITYFEIGRMIVEEELKGKNRAAYAEQIVRQLSNDLTNEFGKGYSKSNLEYMRQFYKTYQNRIIQSPIGQLENAGKSASPVRRSGIVQSLVGQSSLPFSLSWTHYIQLLKIEDDAERK